MKNSWFLKTLFGYTVCISSLEKDIFMRHRPFRSPIIRTEKKILNGLHYDCVVLDEVENDQTQD